MALTNAEIQKRFRDNNTTAYQKIQKKYRKKLGPQAYREMKAKCFERWYFANVYGITLEQYDAMFQEQKGLCKICGILETRVSKRGRILLVVDHDHVTNKVRGLLCSCCNVAIGMMKENVDTMRAAISYIEKSKREQPCDPSSS